MYSGMTDHTRTEKIGDDSIHFRRHPNRAENSYDIVHVQFLFVARVVKPYFDATMVFLFFINEHLSLDDDPSVLSCLNMLYHVFIII